MAKRIGIGIIGGGGISNAHLRPLREREDVDLIGIADIDPQRAHSQQQEYGARRAVTDYHELLADDAVEAVVICLPTHLHRDAVVAAAQAGKHILCEKPMALSLEDADEMLSACESAGVILQLAFVRRFCNEWLKLRELILSGEIGRPVLWRGAMASSGPGPDWFLQGDKGGGPFIDGCVHDWDFALYTFGPAEWVFASTHQWKQQTRPESTSVDTGTIIVRFQSGDELMRCWSWGLEGRGNDNSGDRMHDVIGPRGAILFPAGANQPQFTIHKAGNAVLAEPFEYTTGHQWFAAQMDHFLECVRSGSTPCVGGREGRESLAIALAALESGRTGAPVRLN